MTPILPDPDSTLVFDGASSDDDGSTITLVQTVADSDRLVYEVSLDDLMNQDSEDLNSAKDDQK